MSKSPVEDQLTALRSLRAAAPNVSADAVATQLRPFLLQQNNLVTARAADLARELELRALLADLIAVFKRLLDAPPKKDPQCWAKSALSKALHHLGCDDSSLFLAGMRVHQYEPVWGGQSDVAGTLRSNCAHALVDCRELTHQALLLHLLELVNDRDKAVRAEAIRAIAAAGGDSAILLLRMRSLTATGEPPESRAEIMGHCYAALLSLEGVSAIPFVAQFMKDQDDCSAEAALALGETRTPEALSALLTCLQPPAESSGGRSLRPQSHLEPAFADALLTGIALTRQPEAVDTLMDLVSSESALTEAALSACATADFGSEVRMRLAAIISSLDSDRMNRLHQKYFPA